MLVRSQGANESRWHLHRIALRRSAFDDWNSARNIVAQSHLRGVQVGSDSAYRLWDCSNQRIRVLADGCLKTAQKNKTWLWGLPQWVFVRHEYHKKLFWCSRRAFLFENELKMRQLTSKIVLLRSRKLTCRRRRWARLRWANVVELCWVAAWHLTKAIQP